jgi:ligand-binding sensor domain-containing protein
VKGVPRFEHGAWKDATKEWNFPGKQARQLYFDKTGTLWVATENRAVYLPRGQNRFIDPGNTLGFAFNFAQAPDGAIWVSETGRSAHTIRREDDGKRDTEVRVGATWVLFDRHGSLWVASIGDGLRRVPYPDRIRGKQIAHFGPEAEQFTAKNGLSGAIVYTILEDREGNIWCGTANGLDRFRPGAFLAVDVQPPDLRLSVFATKEGISGRLRPIRVKSSASVQAAERKSSVGTTPCCGSARMTAAYFGSSRQASSSFTGLDTVELRVLRCPPASDLRTSAPSHATTPAVFSYSIFSGAFSA